MSAVGDIVERKDRPAQIEFFREAVEDKAETLKQGRYVAKDVDFVRVFIPYSRDTNIFRPDDWLRQLESDARENRIPPDWVVQYRKLYDAWRTGQELPATGTPIKGWAMISPAKQETLIHYHILTVEDLANMNDEGLRRVGMGAIEMRQMAKTWLAQATDKGPITLRLSALERENELLKANLEALTNTNAELRAEVKALGSIQPRVVVEPTIAAGDII
jgi:hypothetical protein